MIEPHMTLAILSLQKTCQRPAGPKDEDAFYQQYREPFYGPSPTPRGCPNGQSSCRGIRVVPLKTERPSGKHWALQSR
jgi:hypothetical protein